MNPSPYRPNLFWPIVLIGAGVIFLLNNTGVITGNPWPVILNLWPVLLIVAGLDILLGRQSSAGPAIGAILGLLLVGGVLWVLIARPNLAGLNLNFAGGELKTQHVESPLGDIRSARVSIDFTSGSNELHALGDSSKLIEGDLSYYGTLDFSVTGSGSQANILVNTSGISFGFFGGGGEKWDIGLNTRPTYDVDFRLGSGGSTLDLSRLTLSGGSIDVGSGSAEVSLPASGKFTLRISGGSGHLSVRAPRDTALHVEIDRGSGSFSTGSRLRLIGGASRRNEIYESDGFASAANAITLTIDGGSGSISVED